MVEEALVRREGVMKINVKRIPIEGETLRGTEPASIVELDEPDIRFKHDVEYDFHAQVQGDALLVTGTVETPATLRCSRCLTTFELPLRVNQFLFHQQLGAEDFIDLTPNIREDIILELPQRALCEPQCRGLCPTCGKNLNEGACQCEPSRGDLRWHALDQLKLK
jgi:uncharacterized protein